MATLYRQFTDQAQIDAQYNARASVADFAALLAQQQARSAAAREERRCHLRVAYGPTLAETLDLFPADTTHAPVHVFLHGGYWRSLSANDFSFVATGPRKRGFSTVVVDYALCPWVSLDEIVRQARASIAWVYRNIERYGADPARIVVSGHSAGGQLAMMALLTPWQERYGLPDGIVHAALSISGLHDLAPLRYSYLQPALQLDEGLIARNSPIGLVKPVGAPVLVAWGERESAEFERQGREFAAALSATGSSVETLELPEANHFSVLDGFLDPQSPLCEWLVRAADGSRNV